MVRKLKYQKRELEGIEAKEGLTFKKASIANDIKRSMWLVRFLSHVKKLQAIPWWKTKSSYWFPSSFLQNPYFGYFGYQRFEICPSYYSEEMLEQDFLNPKEKYPPKAESPVPEPSRNSTGPETNFTQINAPSPSKSQSGNDTSPTGNTVSNPTAQNGTIPAVTIFRPGSAKK